MVHGFKHQSMKMESLKCSVCLEKYKARKLKVLKPKHPVTVRASSSRKSRSKTEEDAPTGLLSEEVSVIYLVQTILDIPSEECVKYLERYGNPSDWVSLCPSCSTRLRKARNLSDRVVELQRKLEVIKQTIRDQMRVKDELPEGADLEEDDKSWFTAANEIRQYVSYAPSEEEELEMNSIESGGPIDPLSVNIDPGFDGRSMFVDESGDSVYKDEEAEFDFEDSSSLPRSDMGFEDQTSWEAVTIYPDGEEINESDGVNGPNSNEHIHLVRVPPVQLLNPEIARAVDSKDRPLFVLRKARPKADEKGDTGNANLDRVESSSAILLKKTFSCNQCTVMFYNPRQLRNHVFKMHKIIDDHVDHKCTTCEKSIPSILSMEDHIMSAHHPPSVTVCSGCNNQIRRGFNSHLKSSPECREKAFRCPICNSRRRHFQTQAALDIHVEVRHTQSAQWDTFRCSFCNKICNDKHSLKIHITGHHSGKQPIKCDKCGKCFTIRASYKTHLQTVHLNKEPGGLKFPCKTCGRVFTNQSHRRRHEKLHGDDAPFLCTVCGKRYKVGSQLTTHMWSHDPDRYEKYSLYKYKNQPKKPRKKKQVGLPDVNVMDPSAVAGSKSDSAGPVTPNEEENVKD